MYLVVSRWPIGTIPAPRVPDAQERPGSSVRLRVVSAQHTRRCRTLPGAWLHATRRRMSGCRVQILGADGSPRR